DPCPASKGNLDVLDKALSAEGFKTKPVKDRTYVELLQEIEEFSNSLEPNDIAVFYFSGQAIQYEQQNVLFPVDFSAQSSDPNKRALSIGFIESRLKKASSRVLIVEGARPSPNKEKFPLDGLNTAKKLKNSLVLFPAQESSVAAQSCQEPTDLLTRT